MCRWYIGLICNCEVGDMHEEGCHEGADEVRCVLVKIACLWMRRVELGNSRGCALLVLRRLLLFSPATGGGGRALREQRVLPHGAKGFAIFPLSGSCTTSSQTGECSLISLFGNHRYRAREHHPELALAPPFNNVSPGACVEQMEKLNNEPIHTSLLSPNTSKLHPYSTANIEAIWEV